MIDQLLAFRILYMLVTPFKETKAYKLGIINDKGVLQKPTISFNQEENDAYNIFNRLIFNIKRMINSLPGGESKLKNLAAAYFLVKENYDNEYDSDIVRQQLEYIIENDCILVEETLDIFDFLGVFEDAPANSTGPAVSTNEPVLKPRSKKKKFTKDMLGMI